MKKLKEIVAAMPENVTVTKLDGFLIVTISTLVGVIIGMLCSPRKNMKFGCNNGTTEIHNWGSEEDCEEEMEVPVWDEDEEILSFK